jgi:hypothetical protein
MGLRAQRDLLESLAPKRILQRVLLIRETDGQAAFNAAKSALDRIGIPYLVVSPTAIPELFRNEAGTNVCNFNSVLFSLGGIVSNEADRQRIADFELTCGAREAVWYTWPTPEFGLQYIDGTASSAYTATVEDSAESRAFFSRVKPTAKLPVSGAYTYPTTVLDAQTTPLLRNDKGVILALHKTTDGRDVLVSTVDSNPYQTHALAIEYDMLRWLTKGMFVGKKRAYLSAQIDDIFLDNFMWNPTLDTTVEDETSDAARTFRMSGADMTDFVAWQSALRASLPAGSSFITEMAFNGVGATSTTEELVVASRNAGTKLTWVNHTWDHENLDASSRAFTSREVQRNCKRAKDLRLAGFTCSELVTPDMSGLTNPQAVLGMLDAGAKWVVSDTSHTESNFPSAPGDNPSFNVGRYNALDARLYQIPRHPTSVFYNVETPTLHVDEYRFLYDSFWAGQEGFVGPIDYSFVQDKASDFGFLYLLQGDIDPLMFHQANLHNYAAPTGNHSLYGDFIDATVAKYLALSSAPILSLSQDAIGKAMIERDKLDKCGVTVTLNESASGVRYLTLSAVAGCTVPLTGLDKSAYGKVETYNGEKTTSVTLAAGQTITIPL